MASNYDFTCVHIKLKKGDFPPPILRGLFAVGLGMIVIHAKTLDSVVFPNYINHDTHSVPGDPEPLPLHALDHCRPPP
jgi:hypothetical protein